MRAYLKKIRVQLDAEDEAAGIVQDIELRIAKLLYLSFDPNTSRNAALAAQGKAQTAKSIAEISGRSESAAHQLQRIIFLLSA